MGSSLTVHAKTAAKETLYSGVTFRSRLEARWALFFDCVGWDWDYEPCLYKVARHMGYLPDFYLPGFSLWVEVKGEFFLSRESIAKIAASVAGNHRIPLRTPPYGPAHRILIAGDLFPPTVNYRPVHTLVTDSGKGVAEAVHCILTPEGPEVIDKPWMTLDASGVPKPRRPSEGVRRALCNPGASPGSLDPRLENAYIVASVRFPDDKELRLSPQLRAVVGGRRGGRRVR